MFWPKEQKARMISAEAKELLTQPLSPRAGKDPSGGKELVSRVAKKLYKVFQAGAGASCRIS